MKILDKYLKQYSLYLDDVNQKAYKNIYLLSNPTLSKNPYTKTRFLHNLIKNRIEEYSLVKYVLIFYFRNIAIFLLFLPVFLYAKILAVFIKRKNKAEYAADQIVLVDSFYGGREVKNGNFHKDKYFAKLYDYLERKNIRYYIVPKLYGVKNAIKYFVYYNVLKKDNNILIDIDYLKMYDLLKIIAFIFKYPVDVLKLRASIKERKKIDCIFRNDLVYSLSGTDFYPFMRYLFASRLSKKFRTKKMKIISWCEYQVTDKNFYKGLRLYNKNITIYGTQFLFKFPTYSCLYIPESDKNLSIAPDRILVTGKYYVPEKSIYEYSVGPAFRYSDLCDKKYGIDPDNKSIIVMLPYVQEDAFNLIELLKESKFFLNMNIDFKIHPVFIGRRNEYENAIVSGWRMIDEIDNISRYGFVISSGSGSMLEFVCLGLSAIMIESNSAFTTNPMPEYGKNESWAIATNAIELDNVFRELLEFRSSKKNIFEDNVVFYRDNFLSDADDRLITKNFDFNMEQIS